MESKHNGVQLWENGPYWATTNIGAERPEDYGYYFWWGDTVGWAPNAGGDGWVASDGSGKTHVFYDYENCTPTDNKTVDQLKSLGYVDASGNLTAEHDAATQHWGGGGWRMPTRDECIALCDNCDWTWTPQNDVEGYVVKGRGAFSANRIFLPATGYGRRSDLRDAGLYGGYRSSTPYSDSYMAWYLDFASDSYCPISLSSRFDGFSIRAVRGFVQQ